MPDAIITSTESTFGTISGTFLETGATIQGTITGVVAGTLDGSVGVPGPAGSPGATGPQGPQGIQGVPGTPGVGVPAGGTAGQILAKVDGTNYNTQWVNDSGAVVWGDITGTLSNQTDLQTALNAKLDIDDAESSFYPLTGNPSSFLQAAALDPYITSATATATFAPIAAGQPISGTVGQVLTKNSGASWDSSWQTFIPGDRYLTTSTTSLTINNQNKTLTVGTGLSYTTQQDAIISYDASHHMHVRVTAYNPATGQLDVDVISHTGTGTYSAWTVNVGGTVPLQSVEWGEILGVLGDQSDLAGALSSKLEITDAASTYQTLAGMSAYAPLASPVFTGDARAVTPSLADNDTSIATTAFVKGQGYLTSAPVTSVAGRTGAVTLAVADVSGAASTAGPTFTGTVTMDGGTSFSGSSVNIGNSIGSGSFIRIGNGALTSGQVKILDIGSNGGAGSNTFITIGAIDGNTSTTLRGSITAPTQATSDNSTLLATTAFVKAQGYLTSAPVTSVAGRTGAITLANTDISGLGTIATQNASTVNITGGFINGGFTGTTTTAAVDTNTTALASTAFVIGQASSTTPANNGTAAVGTSLRYARADHVHATDTTRAPTASPTFTGTPLSTTAAADTNTTQIATTAFVVGQAGTATPLADNTATVGTSLRYARQDHRHPTDTTRAALAGATFTGLVSTPASAAGSAGLRIVPGVAPTTPTNGDIWATTTDLQVRLNGVTETLAEQSWVTAQGYLTSAPVTSVAGKTGAVSLVVADVSGAAPTASPALSGTPTAPTATAGTNTTQIATTAFVLANAGSTSFATAADAVLQSSTTTALSPATIPFALSNGLTQRFDYNTITSVSGSGAVTSSLSGFRQMYTTSTGTNGRATFASGLFGQVSTVQSTNGEGIINFSKKIWMSGRFSSNISSLYVGDANGFVSISLGGYSALTTGSMTVKGIGLRKVGGASSVIQLVVHNGTTQTLVNTTKTVQTGEVVDYLVYSDGAGNVQLYINGYLDASSSSGPTGLSGSYQNLYREQVEQTSSATARHLIDCFGGQIIIER